jgi:hypothetical protein
MKKQKIRHHHKIAKDLIWRRKKKTFFFPLDEHSLICELFKLKERKVETVR